MKPVITHLTDIILIFIVVISVYTDLKERKIYNLVVLPAMLAGLIINTIFYGVDGLMFSLKGLGAGIGLLFIPFAMGGIGAGDVKLMGAIGSLTGTLFVARAFLATGLIGGIISVVVLVKQKRLLTTLKNLWFCIYIFIGTVFRVNTLKDLDNAEDNEAIPYGLAIGIGTFLAYLVR